MDEESLCFLYKISSNCKSVAQYISILSQICIVFPKEEAIKSPIGQQNIAELVIQEKESLFYNNIHTMAKRRKDVVSIKTVFSTLESRTVKFKFDKNHMNIDEQLLCLSYIVFKMYLVSDLRFDLRIQIIVPSKKKEALSKRKSNKQKNNSSNYSSHLTTQPIIGSSKKVRRINKNTSLAVFLKKLVQHQLFFRQQQNQVQLLHK